MDLDPEGPDQEDREALVADQDPADRDRDLEDQEGLVGLGRDRAARLIVPTANPSSCNASC